MAVLSAYSDQSIVVAADSTADIRVVASVFRAGGGEGLSIFGGGGTRWLRKAIRWSKC
jgi:hypothetical protein